MPVLVYVAGQDAPAATTTSLIVVGLSALVGCSSTGGRIGVRAGRGVVFGLAGIGGSLAGSALNRGLDPNLPWLAFAGIVLLAAWRMVTGCPSCTNVGEREAIGGAESRIGGGGTAVIAGLRIDIPTVANVLAAGTVGGLFTGLSVWAAASSSCLPSLSAFTSPCPRRSAPPCSLSSSTRPWPSPPACVRPVSTGQSGPIRRRGDRGHGDRQSPRRPRPGTNDASLVRRAAHRRGAVHRHSVGHRPRIAVWSCRWRSRDSYGAAPYHHRATTSCSSRGCVRRTWRCPASWSGAT